MIKRFLRVGLGVEEEHVTYPQMLIHISWLLWCAKVITKMWTLQRTFRCIHTIELSQQSYKVSIIIIIVILIFQIKELGFRELNGLAQRHTAAWGAEGTRTHVRPCHPSLAPSGAGCFMRSKLLPLCGS